MFSNHHEIMLILIFISKLPREGGELFFKKTSPTLCQSPLRGNTCLVRRRYGSLQGILCASEPWERLCLLTSRTSDTLRPHHCSVRSSISFGRASNKSAGGREARFFTYTGKSQRCRNTATFCSITGFWYVFLLC